MQLQKVLNSCTKGSNAQAPKAHGFWSSCRSTRKMKRNVHKQLFITAGHAGMVPLVCMHAMLESISNVNNERHVQGPGQGHECPALVMQFYLYQHQRQQQPHGMILIPPDRRVRFPRLSSFIDIQAPNQSKVVIKTGFAALQLIRIIFTEMLAFHTVISSPFHLKEDCNSFA